MQLKYSSSHYLLWFGIVEHMKTHGVNNISLCGFMVDNAIANWISVNRVFDNGNPNEPMKSTERTCESHWVQSIKKHKKVHIKKCFYEEFDSLAYAHKQSETLDECDVNCHKF